VQPLVHVGASRVVRVNGHAALTAIWKHPVDDGCRRGALTSAVVTRRTEVSTAGRTRRGTPMRVLLRVPRPSRYSGAWLALSGRECQNLLNRALTGGRIP
jgi:hypothetical protein